MHDSAAPGFKPPYDRSIPAREGPTVRILFAPSGESGANLISGRNLFDDPGSGPLIILDTPIDLRFVDLSEMLAQEGEHLGT